MGAGVLPFQRACDVSDAELWGLKRAIRVAEAPHGTHVFWLIGRALPYALWESDSVSALSVIIAEAPFSKLAVSESLSIRIPQGACFGYSYFLGSKRVETAFARISDAAKHVEYGSHDCRSKH